MQTMVCFYTNDGDEDLDDVVLFYYILTSDQADVDVCPSPFGKYTKTRFFLVKTTSTI